MQLLSRLVPDDPAAAPLPPSVLTEAERVVAAIRRPEEAQTAFDRLLPALKSYKADPRLVLQAAMLVEKQRKSDGMLEFWSDLALMFPGEVLPLRMAMRWHRRAKRNAEGLRMLHAATPDAPADLTQAETRLMGLSELRAFTAIDEMMVGVLATFPGARPIRMRYIQCLAQQSRYIEADRIAAGVVDREKLGASSRAVLDLIETKARILRRCAIDREDEILGSIVKRLADSPVRPLDRSRVGAVAFFTGQLGTGGAERQMTRLASSFQAIHESGGLASRRRIMLPPQVCVRHATPGSGDFFLPVLRRAGVETTVLADIELPKIDGIDEGVRDLLSVIPEDLAEHTAKLLRWFRDKEIEVAYLWQDGGVLSAALAALLAGVPRIVTSFRGLPPNLRPALLRPEMPALYRALACLPHVTFSSNSAATACAYEDWLGLREGRIAVLPNAIPPVLPEGNPADEEWWARTLHRSPGCSRTVLGIFRFDDNKRPLLWVNAAAAYAEQDPTTRFVLVGSGHDFPTCADRIRSLGMEDRIFLAGLRQNVGFFLHRADLVMHLARMEGLPNVLIEAQLAGVPVLATPAGGTAEVVEDRQTGRLLPCAEAPTIPDIATLLAEMLGDADELTRMGAEARRHSEPRFLIDKIIDRTVDLFLDVKGSA
ncbi:glycosyltransferase [Aestuariibius sp. 2305UL40-4]|uniref:glycosyltransferase n=1 Tax=Aestuariibius violaceus TaxID=3234132 RepID=UPI003481DED3